MYGERSSNLLLIEFDRNVRRRPFAAEEVQIDRRSPSTAEHSDGGTTRASLDLTTPDPEATGRGASDTIDEAIYFLSRNPAC